MTHFGNTPVCIVPYFNLRKYLSKKYFNAKKDKAIMVQHILYPIPFVLKNLLSSFLEEVKETCKLKKR